MEVISTDDVWSIIQEANPDKYILTCINVGDDQNINFHKYDDMPSIINYFIRGYGPSLILDDVHEDLWTKNDTIVSFDDEKYEILFITYKNNGDLYKIYEEEIYQYIKEKIKPLATMKLSVYKLS